MSSSEFSGDVVTLDPNGSKSREAPPEIGDANAPPVGVLTPEQVDDAVLGSY
jgi:hypothetical protein